jgi:hypothetical protein
MPSSDNDSRSEQRDPPLELLGSGRDLWADEYVQRLGEFWEPPAN